MTEGHFIWVPIISDFIWFGKWDRFFTASDNFTLQFGQIQNFIVPSVTKSYSLSL